MTAARSRPARPPERDAATIDEADRAVFAAIGKKGSSLARARTLIETAKATYDELRDARADRECERNKGRIRPEELETLERLREEWRGTIRRWDEHEADLRGLLDWLRATPRQSDTDEWISSTDAANLSGLSTDAFRKRAERDGWKTRPRGRLLLYRLADLEDAWPDKRFRLRRPNSSGQ